MKRNAKSLNDNVTMGYRYRTYEGGCEMKLKEIREIAKKWGVDVSVGRTKRNIICDIQISEGYSPCYGTKDACGNDCLWKKDCTNNK